MITCCWWEWWVAFSCMRNGCVQQKKQL